MPKNSGCSSRLLGGIRLCCPLPPLTCRRLSESDETVLLVPVDADVAIIGDFTSFVNHFPGKRGGIKGIGTAEKEKGPPPFWQRAEKIYASAAARA